MKLKEEIIKDHMIIAKKGKKYLQMFNLRFNLTQTDAHILF